ncbi:9201_t:CDS:2 [Ambispora gerdemannii]|uniref:9201_t:CDS:1 n=1 Tax=Ambispora gerdemannii TaxID=144530 RepID=A0A9N9F846_9GLOM|nr:9201_t:CDS:2 [Ambispora gerdemannii]
MKPTETSKNIWIAAGDGEIERVQEFRECKYKSIVKGDKLWFTFREILITELISRGISPNEKDQNGYTPLAAAVSYNHIAIIELLISNGADVNIRDNEGDTPLCVAETVEAAQLLLQHGADPFIRNTEGKTPAQVAFEEEWLDVAHLLRSITGERQNDSEAE